MPLLPRPQTHFGPAPSLSAQVLAGWIGLGALTTIVIAVPSTLFDLDRFAAPKELALHLTALGALILLALTRGARTPLVAADLPLLAFVAWSSVSALLATNRWLSTRSLAVTLAGVILFRAGRRVAARGSDGIVLVLLAVALGVGALSGLAQAYGFDAAWLADSRAPGGTLGNRNFLAHLMAIGAPVVLLLVVEARGPRRAVLAAGVLGLMFGATILTRSRAGWLGFLLCGVIMGAAALVARRQRPDVIPGQRFRLALVALIVAGGLALLLPNRLSWRSDSPYGDTMRDLANYREGSGRGRLIQYRNSLRLVPIDPVFGSGPGNWPVQYPRVTSPGDPSYAGADPMPTNPWPSSDWVAMLTERGVIGALLLLASLAAMGVTALRRIRSEDPREARRAVALLGVITATAVTGGFDAVLLLAPPTLLFWTAAGALLPVTGAVDTAVARRRRGGGVMLGLMMLLAVLRSAGQTRAILLAGPGWPVERLIGAVRFDPGSYRLHLMIAQRTGCARARPHALAAARLFPRLPAPARRLAVCGGE